MSPTTTVLIAGEVGRDGVQPGRKLAAVVTLSMSIHPRKRFLSEVIRIFFVIQHSEEELIHRSCVAFHQSIQRRVMAAGQALHVCPILLGSINALHAHRRKPAYPPSNVQSPDETQASASASRSNNACLVRGALPLS